jgi:hypothetical protein
MNVYRLTLRQWEHTQRYIQAWPACDWLLGTERKMVVKAESGQRAGEKVCKHYAQRRTEIIECEFICTVELE